MLTGIKSEFLKIKGSFTYWFTIISAILIPFLVFLIFLFKPEFNIPPEGVNAWDKFFDINLSIISSLLFPFYIILTVALNFNIEHKENSWKKLLILPVSRSSIYLNKALFLLLQITTALLLFLLAIFASGFVLGIIHPELAFLSHSIKLGPMLKALLRLFVSILGIFSIQYLLSLFFKNIIIPIASGMFFTIAALIVALRWKYAVYFAYAFPQIIYSASREQLNVKSWHGIFISEPVGIAIFLVAIITGMYIFKNKQLK